MDEKNYFVLFCKDKKKSLIATLLFNCPLDKYDLQINMIQEYVFN